MFLKGSYRRIKPDSAAIIMAIGIFIIGAIKAFPLLNVYLGSFLASGLFFFWIVIYGLLTIQFFNKNFLIPFIQHPIHSFAMGTWIAGISVLCMVFLDFFPGLIRLTQIIAIFNSLLWVLFLIISIANFKKLLFSENHYFIHGVLLLSTVATQSIVVLLSKVFLLSNIYLELLIYLGLVFYLISSFIIIRSIMTEKNWTIVKDWGNTNCIIHGALSITGFAIVTTASFSPLVVNYFWLFTFILLIIVECLELIRAKRRIDMYGWNKGVFSYHISQWSRNFTFGMFYVFTLLLTENPNYHLSSKINLFQINILNVWAWIVLVALTVEIMLFIKEYLNLDRLSKILK